MVPSASFVAWRQIIRNADGRPAAWVGINRDVTDLIDAERDASAPRGRAAGTGGARGKLARLTTMEANSRRPSPMKSAKTAGCGRQLWK